MLEDLNNFKFINTILIKTNTKYPLIFEQVCQAFEMNKTFMIVELEVS